MATISARPRAAASLEGLSASEARFEKAQKAFRKLRDNETTSVEDKIWPAPGSEDTELGVLMELEVGHGEASVYAGVQA